MKAQASAKSPTLREQPTSIARALAISLGLGLAAIVAGVAVDHALAALGFPSAYDPTIVLVTVLAFLGAALIVASIAFSAIQSAVERWPSYIYASVMQEREPMWFLYAIGAGMITGLGTLGLAAANSGLGYGGSLICLLVSFGVVVVLIHYIATQTLQLDPIVFADRLRREMAQTRAKVWVRSMDGRDHTRASREQLRYLRATDQLLGMSRWLAELHRPHDAVEVLWMVVDELDDYRKERARRARVEPWSVRGYWNYRRTYAPLYADLPGSSSSFLAMLQPWEPHPTSMSGHPSETDWGCFWLEEHALTWTICSATYVQEKSPRVEVVRWEQFLDRVTERLDDALDVDAYEREAAEGAAPRATGLAAAETLLINTTRPLLLPGLANRRSRDASIRTLARLHSKVADRHRQSPEDFARWHATLFPYVRGNSLLAQRRFPIDAGVGDALGFFGQLSRTICNEREALAKNPVVLQELLMLIEDHTEFIAAREEDGLISDAVVEALDMRHAGTLAGRGVNGIWSMLKDCSDAAAALRELDESARVRYLCAATVVHQWLTRLPTWHLRTDLRVEVSTRILNLIAALESCEDATETRHALDRARSSIRELDRRYEQRPVGVGYADLPH